MTGYPRATTLIGLTLAVAVLMTAASRPDAWLAKHANVQKGLTDMEVFGIDCARGCTAEQLKTLRF